MELADDAAAAARLRDLYDTLETSTTPASVLFPWFPSPSAVRKIASTKKIHDVVSEAVDARLKGHVIPQDDALQLMVDNKDDRTVMIGVCITLFARRSPR